MSAHLSKSHGRLTTRGQRQLGSVREPLDNGQHRLLQHAGLDKMGVIEHEHEASLQPGPDPDPGQRDRDRVRQALNVVHASVERRPSKRPGAARIPLHQQARLAISSRSDDEHERSCPPLLQPLDQLSTGDEIAACLRKLESGLGPVRPRAQTARVLNGQELVVQSRGTDHPPSLSVSGEPDKVVCLRNAGYAYHHRRLRSLPTRDQGATHTHRDGDPMLRLIRIRGCAIRGRT